MTVTDFSHLDAIQSRIRREEQRLPGAKTASERAFREHEIMMAKREEAAEYKFLGIEPVSLDDISADDLDALLAELAR